MILERKKTLVSDSIPNLSLHPSPSLAPTFEWLSVSAWETLRASLYISQSSPVSPCLYLLFSGDITPTEGPVQGHSSGT